MKPLFLYCSDTHLRSRRPDEQYAFQQIIDRAVRLRVDVVAAGDLFDRQANRSDAVTFAYRQLNRLTSAKLTFYYTQGQHDFDDPPWLHGHPSAVHMHKQEIDFGEVIAYGLDWQPFGKLQEELAEVPGAANFLVTHQVWGDWMGDIAAPQGEFAQIPGHVKYLATGDLHQWRLEQKRNADGAKMTVCSTGATTQQKISEPAEHFYALFYPDGRFAPQKLNSRVMIAADVMNRPEDVDRFVAEIDATLAEAAQRAAAMDLPAAMQKPYLRVTYSGTMPDALRRITRAVADRAILYPTELVPEEKTAAYKASAQAAGGGAAVTPISVLHEEVDRDDEPDVYELVERMLLASDQEQEFARWRSDQMGEAEKRAAADS